MADINEFGRWDGQLRLVGVKDLDDRRIVDSSIGEHQTTGRAVNALVMAPGRRDPVFGDSTSSPGTTAVPGLVSDRTSDAGGRLFT